jgi:NADH-quinone oxidoreductase subunit J
MAATDILFYLFAALTLLCGFLVVANPFSRSPIVSAMFLVLTIVSMAGLFVLLHAFFLAAVQILVYAGAVMVLFLFVIMLVNVGAEEEGRAPIFNRSPQVAAALVFALLLVMSLLLAINQGYAGMKERDAAALQQAEAARTNQQAKMQAGATGVSRLSTETERVGNSLFTTAALPFEIASVLLLVAIIGSVMLARTLKQEASADDVDPEVMHTKSGEQEMEGQG